MKKLFFKISIIGTGLIGGSIALAARKKGLAGEIIGICRHDKTMALAKKLKIVDLISKDIDNIKGSDLVIFATPVETIKKLAPRASKLLDKKCVVTDIGSTKQGIVRILGAKFENFLGSHPLAGSEKRGAAYANASIFKGSVCILTPTAKTSRMALRKIEKFWKSLGVKTVKMPAEQHDAIISLTSHLPHLLAFSLMTITPKDHFKFAAGGFKDTTRIAASDSEIWSDIFLNNSDNLIKSLRTLQKQLQWLKNAISQKNSAALKKYINRAKGKRILLQ